MFKELLSGNKAFYNHPNYLEETKKDLIHKGPLPSIYKVSFAKLGGKTPFPSIFSPISTLFHSTVGKTVLPASTPYLLGFSKKYADLRRAQISLNGEWKYKRFTIEVEGYKIDTMIMGKEFTLNNGRWVLASNGNGEFYEDKLLYHYDLKPILDEIHGNALVFNYPGVGASSGLPNAQAMVNAYSAMLKFLEDSEKGIGAKEIIGYGHSIGAAVQGEALKIHELKEDIRYVFVKSRTFSNLSTIATALVNRLAGYIIVKSGWNLDSIESSRKLRVSEIILQTAHVQRWVEINDSSLLIDDGVVPAHASLAKVLLNDETCPKEKKLFLGIPEMHNEVIIPTTFLTKRIEEFLS